MKKFFKLGLCLGLLTVQAAFAAQVFEVKPDASITARVSMRESMRIKVDGEAITDMYGSVRAPDDTTSAASAGAELIAVMDPAHGEVYVTVSEMASAGKPINVFVTTARATYTLLLVPADIPSDTIVLRDRSGGDGVGGGGGGGGGGGSGRGPSWLRDIKMMMLTMAGEEQTDLPGREVQRTVDLWQEVSFVEKRRFDGHPRFIGVHYVLTNTSGAVMKLDEREFFTRGVAGVMIDSKTLPPNASTDVYVVRTGERDGR